MKKMRKYVLLVLALNMLFFSVESEKRKAEAFAIETAALILGGMAIVGAGGMILSRSGAGTLGEKISSGFEAAGGKIADIFSYNSVTDKGNLVMNLGLKVAMNNAIGQLKSDVSNAKAEYQNSSTLTTPSGYVKMASDITASKGDVLEVSFDYSVAGSPGQYYYGQVYAGYISGVSPNALSAASKINLSEFPSGHYSKTVVVTADIASKTVYGAGSGSDGSLTISNLSVRNLSKMETPAYQQYKQYEAMPANADDRMAQINTALNKSEYAVSANSVQENVSSISQLEASMTAIEDNTAGTNTLIDRMITALGNIPAAIKTEMSDLWADAGAIWTGMSDKVTDFKTDVGAKIGAMSDSMAGGIDNIRTDMGTMFGNLRAGIDSAATAAAANLASWGQLTMDGIESGVGTISEGLSSLWTGVAAIPQTIVDGVGDLTDSITGLFTIPVAKMDENKAEMTAAKELFIGKFDWITVPIEQIKSLYAQRKSLFDVSVVLMGERVWLIPSNFRDGFGILRNVLSGAAIMSTTIFVYRRIQPKDVM